MNSNLEELNGLLRIPAQVIEEIEKSIKKPLDKSGMFYRVFCRVKSPESLNSKLSNSKYCDNKKVQDLIGARIVLYFRDDIYLCKKIIKKTLDVIDISEDQTQQEIFKPTRLNIVCKIPENISKMIDSTLFDNYYIDKTFEIQIRTVFSEGWHEVEHDFRYKHKDEWGGSFSDLSRALNGIFATLETCDRAIIDLLNQYSYKKYQEKSWDAMIRNKLRIRFKNIPLSRELTSIFEHDTRLAKSFFNIDRMSFISILAFEQIGTFANGNINNIVYTINELFINNEEISKLCPPKITEVCKDIRNLHN